MAAKMHLMQMLIHTACTHTLLGWADPRDQQLDGLEDFAYWQGLARTLERGCFDGVFFADSLATHAVYKGSSVPSVQYGASWPNHDPMPLVAIMAAATQHLGIGVTLFTTGTTPYLATRRISTLNYLSRRIPLDAILARLSGVFGVDLSQFDPDRPLAEMETQASRGLMAATLTGADGQSVTLRQAAAQWALSVAIPQVVGTPEQVAAEIEHTWRATGCAGFNLSPNTNPDSVDDFVDPVVPILQRRGVFRSEYEGKTFRENLAS